jgi:hypothetical protein
MWIMTNRTTTVEQGQHPQWKRNARSLEIPSPQCLLLGKLESQDVIIARTQAERLSALAATSAVGTNNNASIAPAAPGGFSDPEQLLIATGEGQGALDDDNSFPVYIWRGGPTRAPTRTPTQPLAPPSSKSARMGVQDDAGNDREGSSSHSSEEPHPQTNVAPVVAAQASLASPAVHQTSAPPPHPVQQTTADPSGGMSTERRAATVVKSSVNDHVMSVVNDSTQASASPSKRRLTGPRSAQTSESAEDDDMSVASDAATSDGDRHLRHKVKLESGRRRGKRSDVKGEADIGASGPLLGDDLVKNVISSLVRVPGLSASMESLLKACMELPPGHPRRR